MTDLNKADNCVQGDSPQGASSVRSTCTLTLTDTVKLSECPCWLGLYASGNLSCRELLREPLDQLLGAATSMGLAEQSPVMLAQTQEAQTAYRTFLLPVNHHSQERQFSQVVASWPEKAVGFYMPLTLLSPGQVEQILAKTIDRLLVTTTVSTFYFWVPDLMQTSTLNLAFRVKSSLAHQGIQLNIYH